MEQNVGIYWIQDASKLPYWESSAPLRVIFHRWFSQQNIQLTHAAAVGTTQGGILLVGKGGSGKSTTALTCLDSALFYAGDDYCLLANSDAATVHSIYSTGKKRANDIERLPSLMPKISNRDRLEHEKALYFVHQHFPEKVIKQFPLRAIVIPRVTGALHTTVQPASAAAALGALAPSTIFQLPHAGKLAFERMSEIVRQIPAYYLNLGTDTAQIPAQIMLLLEQVKENT